MINSLSQLQGYYQSRYEHYLAMATEAKEHRERVSLLLQDILAHSSDEENYLMEKPQNNESIEAKSLDNGRGSPLLSSASPTELDEDSFGVVDSSQMRRFLNSVSQVMSVIESYDLPPSNKLKPTLLETIRRYIADCNPTRFSIEDVINYLYSQEQQSGWSQSKKNKVRSSISNVLSRKAYLGKQWRRIRPGIYQPL